MWEFVHASRFLLSMVLTNNSLSDDACETWPHKVFVWFGVEIPCCVVYHVMSTHSGSMGCLTVADGMMFLSSTGGSTQTGPCPWSPKDALGPPPSLVNPRQRPCGILKGGSMSPVGHGMVCKPRHAGRARQAADESQLGFQCLAYTVGIHTYYVRSSTGPAPHSPTRSSALAQEGKCPIRCNIGSQVPCPRPWRMHST